MDKTTTDRRALRHIPVNLPRAGFPGERIYLELWREYLRGNHDAIPEIFCDLRQPLDQRGARVAASFMVWMGCNSGRSFTFNAERLAKSGAFVSRSRAFIAAWALENLRVNGVNGGLILTESMLTPGGIPRTEAMVSYCIDWRSVYAPTQYDNDVLACMVQWWAGFSAQQLRTIAEHLIEAEREKERAGWASAAQPAQQGAGREDE
ncbi:hypothetical protein LMG26788_03734 [Achromobacter pulmonis]|uniref:Uncharacterized protein n=1 Tax=Achromobacter pulmonis TaxID=1389932 RepID=A0A6S7DD28_9BURK|nr:hypothetical protein [Achromobacter pulmonis]CAB3888875.1 hypothetical protein LMG26788_03668 [Achromobacter pulmonis]CAB3890172.1 hypothetical protein LMG26788_03734 [Achromobacter pulmonis]